VLITTSPSFVFMCYHNKCNSKYAIDRNAIPHSFSCKNLGIFTDNLTWRLHYQNIASRAYKSFGLLHRIFKDNYCPETRKSLYISVIGLHLLCSKIYLLFFPALLKIFTYYSFQYHLLFPNY